MFVYLRMVRDFDEASQIIVRFSAVSGAAYFPPRAEWMDEWVGLETRPHVRLVTDCFLRAILFCIID